MIKKFCICNSHYAMELEEEVNKKLEEGWELHGQPFTRKKMKDKDISGYPNGYYENMCQAMVLTVHSKKG